MLQMYLLLVISLVSLQSFSQDFTGTWKGKFFSDMYNPRRTFEFTVQLKENGRAVWGIYTTSPGDGNSCSCTLSGQVSKKDRSAVSLYRNDVLEYPEYRAICDFLNFFEMKLKVLNGKVYITGKWFGITTSPYRSDGANGSFALEKVNDQPETDVSRYFPKLEKMIKTYNKGEPVEKKETKGVL